MPEINYLVVMLLSFLVVLSIVVLMMDNLLYVIIVFGAYSLIMSLVWQQFNAPDIAITEAAVGVGSTVLMVAVLTRIRKGKKQ